MRPAPLLLLLVGLTSSVAEAQPTTVDSRLTIHRDRELSCSQSYESIGRTLALRLRVAANGDASLTLDASSSETSGPAESMFQPGSADSSHVERRERHEWTGTATHRDGRLELVFDRDRSSSVAWQGPGTVPLPPQRALRTNLRIECEPASLSVHPAPEVAEPPSTAGLAETASVVAGLHCRVVDGAPDVLRDEASEPLPFSLSRPLALYVSDGMMRGRELRFD